MKDLYRLAKIIETTQEIADYWNSIRAFYELLTPRILDGERFDPYMVDWTKIFTPIESDAWSYLRQSSMEFYPQYPLLNYFVDFADPITKIAIELDGRMFHDVKKDQERDRRIAKIGWRVYRIKGSEAVKDEFKFYDLWDEDNDWTDGDFEDSIDEWLNNTADGIITAIDLYHYGKVNLPYHEYIKYQINDYYKAKQCLQRHCLIKMI